MTHRIKTLTLTLASLCAIGMAAPTFAAAPLQERAHRADVEKLTKDLDAAIAAVVAKGGSAADIQAAIEQTSALDGFDALTLQAALARVTSSDGTDLAIAKAAEAPLVNAAAHDEVVAAQALASGSSTATSAAAAYATALSSANSGGGYVVPKT